MKFKYFRDPDNFAFKVESPKPCSICRATGVWFSASAFFGQHEIECICDKCLSNGELETLGIEANGINNRDTDEAKTILYRTPALPTWQDHSWPQVDGEYCIFERIASKNDFTDKNELLNSLSLHYLGSSDIDWLWDQLPEKAVNNIEEGNFNVSVYLFSCRGIKLCIWDAS